MTGEETGTVVGDMPQPTKTKKSKATKKAVKKATKKAAKKAVAAGGERKRYTDDMKINVTDPERAGKMHDDSRRAQSFKLIKAGMTVAKYLEKGGDRLDLNIMDKLGIVSVK